MKEPITELLELLLGVHHPCRHGSRLAPCRIDDWMHRNQEILRGLVPSGALREKGKPWRWVKGGSEPQVARHLLDGKDRCRATVWINGTWHTWNEDGVGGENDVCAKVNDAMDQAMAAIVRQGWSPWKVEYAK